MKEILKSFVQGPDGSWTCIRPGSHVFGLRKLDIPAGTCFRRGKPFNGVDVASFLDHRQRVLQGGVSPGACGAALA